ncbi:hypothetical protein EWU39_15180 [Enterococcus faecium]|nr:hypothetical protein EWU39_15180 [Enterococcus faecium]TAQ20242.1 hypothetical protein EWU31_14085 [Enterococcus faecium]
MVDLTNTKVYFHYSKGKHTYEDHIIDLINNLKEIIFLEEDSMSFTSSRSESIFFREFKKIVDAVID